MTIAGKIIAAIGHFFVDLFNAYDAAWMKLEPEIRTVLVQASTIAQIIKVNLTADPAHVIELIKIAFPTLDMASVTKVFNAIAKDLDTSIVVIDADPLKTLGNIQQFLLTLKGTGWDNGFATLSQLLGMCMGAGFGLNWQTVALFAEYVYQKLVKKS